MAPTARSRPAASGWQLVAAALLLLSAGLSARMVLGARGQLGRAGASTDLEERAIYLRRAMAYYLPGNPYVRRAHDQLLAQARLARTRGQRTLALASYRELRSAILALRGLTTPYGDSLPEVNAALARLTVAAASESTPSTPLDEQRLLSRLQAPPAPRLPWALCGVAGFVLWVGAAVLAIWRGLTPQLSLRPRRFWPLLALCLVGMALFAAGMASA